MNAYLTREGDILYAQSKLELVEKMRSYTTFTQTQRVQEYMRGYAQRVKEIFGLQIAHDSPDSFVDSLIREDIIQKLEVDEVSQYQNRTGLK